MNRLNYWRYLILYSGVLFVYRYRWHAGARQNVTSAAATLYFNFITEQCVTTNNNSIRTGTRARVVFYRTEKHTRPRMLLLFITRRNFRDKCSATAIAVTAMPRYERKNIRSQFIFRKEIVTLILSSDKTPRASRCEIKCLQIFFLFFLYYYHYSAEIRSFREDNNNRMAKDFAYTIKELSYTHTHTHKTTKPGYWILSLKRFCWDFSCK